MLRRTYPKPEMFARYGDKDGPIKISKNKKHSVDLKDDDRVKATREHFRFEANTTEPQVKKGKIKFEVPRHMNYVNLFELLNGTSDFDKMEELYYKLDFNEKADHCVYFILDATKLPKKFSFAEMSHKEKIQFLIKFNGAIIYIGSGNLYRPHQHLSKCLNPAPSEFKTPKYQVLNDLLLSNNSLNNEGLAIVVIGGMNKRSSLMVEGMFIEAHIHHEHNLNTALVDYTDFPPNEEDCRHIKTHILTQACVKFGADGGPFFRTPTFDSNFEKNCIERHDWLLGKRSSIVALFNNKILTKAHVNISLEGKLVSFREYSAQHVFL